MPCASRKSRRSSRRARSPGQGIAQRSREALAAWPAQAVARARIDAGGEQRLAGIDVARANDHLTGEQDRLDAAPAAAAGAACRKAPSKAGRTARPSRRAASQPARGRVPATTAPRRSAAGRSGARCRGRRDQVEMVVRPRAAARPRQQRSDPDMPRCSSSPPAIEPRVPRAGPFPTVCPTSESGGAAEGPAQGLAEPDAGDLAPRAGADQSPGA